MQSFSLRIAISRAIRSVSPTFATLVTPEDLIKSLRSMPEAERAELAAILEDRVLPSGD